MIPFLLIVALILIILLLGMVHRVFTLTNIAKENSQSGASTRVGSSNKINAILFMVFFIVMFGLIFWYSPQASEFYLGDPASEHGHRIDNLFWITTGVVFTVFFLTHVLLLFFPFIYRFKEGRKVDFYTDNHKLEFIWTIIPAIVLTALVLSGWWVWSDVMAEVPENHVEIEVLGKQFNWQVRYGGKDNKIGKYNFRKIDATNSVGMDFEADPSNMDDFMTNELVLPKGKNVLLKIRSRDVLHSVFLPHFRVKMDAVPGMPTQFWFTPKYSTAEMRTMKNNNAFNYELACTEICGKGHFAMKLNVVVLEEAEYEKWYAEQEAWSSKNKDYVDALGLNKGVASAQ